MEICSDSNSQSVYNLRSVQWHLYYLCKFYNCPILGVHCPILQHPYDVEAETPVLWPPDAKSWLIWKDPDAGKDWGQEEKGKTGQDGWMASPTQWTWVCVDSRSWWWTGSSGVLRFMGSQRVRHNWATELNWVVEVIRPKL